MYESFFKDDLREGIKNAWATLSKVMNREHAEAHTSLRSIYTNLKSEWGSIKSLVPSSERNKDLARKVEMRGIQLKEFDVSM